jgi:hypothetical protein
MMQTIEKKAVSTRKRKRRSVLALSLARYRAQADEILAAKQAMQRVPKADRVQFERLRYTTAGN